MDFESLTRKQLQGLCKKHGVPANLTNRDMADRLSSILKESENLASQGKSVGENSRKKRMENGSKAKTKVAKKVRFSPKNETFVYEISGYKRGGRRRCTMKLLPKKQIQATENDVSAPLPVGRKRAKSDVKCQSVEAKSTVACDGNVSGGLIRRQLRNKEVVVEISEGDLVPSRKKVKGRSSKTVRNVPVENVVAREDDKLEEISKIGGRFTRSRGRDSEIGEYQGGCDKVPQLEEPSMSVAEMGLQKANQDVANDEGFEMLGGNSRKVINVNRFTRSRAKTAGEACAAESKNEVETSQSEEVSRGLSKYASRRKSVVSKKSKKRSRNSDLEGASDLEAIQDTNKVFEMVKNVSVPSGPSRRTRRNTVMFNSTVSADVDLETQQNVGQKDAFLTNNVARRSRRNVTDSAVNSAEPDRVLQQTEPNVVKNQDSEILSGNPRRFNSVNEITKSHMKTVGKACAAESENEEENVQLQEHSKRLVRQTSRQKSVVSQTGKVRSDGLQEKDESRKRSRNNELERLLELEAIVEPGKELEMAKNVSVPSGPSRRTRRNTVMLKSSMSANELLENHQTAGQGENNLTKNLRKSSQLASTANSTVTSSEVDGTAVDVRKVRQQKRRKEPIVDDDASLSECKPLAKRPLKRSTRIASKMDVVEPADSTGKAVGKKQHGGSKMLITEQKALCSEKLSAPEAGSLAVEEANKEDASSNKQVFEASKKKREAHRGKIGANKQHSPFEASVVISDTREAVDTAVDLEETLVSTSVKLPSISRYQVTHNSVSEAMVPHEEFSLAGDILDGDKDDNSCFSLNKRDDFGDRNVVEHEMVEMEDNVSNLISSEISSPVLGFSPNNQSDDSAEPLNSVDLEKIIGEGEPSLGQNINHRSDNVDNQSNEDERSSVKEYQNLEQAENAKETTAEPLVQEAVFEKKSDIPQDTSEGKDEVGPSNVAGISDTEEFPEAIKMQEFTADSNLVTTEIGTERTVESQSGTEVNEAQEQNAVQSTVLERSNINFIGQEDFSVKGTKIPDDTTSGCEISGSKAGNGIRRQVMTEDNVTTDRLETEEAFYSERASQVVGEKIINKGYEGNLLVGSSAIPVSVKIDGKDAKKKENISERYIQDPRENENEDSEKTSNNVSEETGEECIHELPDAAVSSSELVVEKIYDGAELDQETNCSVDIRAADVTFNEDYTASMGIDGGSLDGESNVEQCADVAKQENTDCTVKVDLGDKSDHEVVAPEVNGTAGKSLKEFISKGSEVSDEKADGTMMKPAKCGEGVDNIKVEESKFEDRNSDIKVMDIGALAEVSGTHLVEDKAMEELDGSIQYERIEADREAQTVAMKRKDFLDEAGNVESLVPSSPLILGKTFGDEFSQTNDSTGVSNEAITADAAAEQGEGSNEFMGFAPHVDEVNFGDLDNHKEQVSDLERSAHVIVTADNLMATNSKAADVRENAETVAGNLNSYDISSGAEKDNVDAIPQVTTNDTDDLQAPKLCNADDDDQCGLFNRVSSKIGVAEEDAVEVSVDGKTGCENTDAATKWIEETPIFSQTSKSERKHGEKNSAAGKILVDTSSNKPEIGSANDAVEMDSPTTLIDQKVSEHLNDFITGLDIEDNAGTADKQPNANTGAVTDTAFTDGIFYSTSNNLSHSNRRKLITEVAAEGVHSDKLSDMVVTEGIEEPHALPSLTPRLSVNCSASFPTVAHSRYERKSLEFNSDSPQLTSREMNVIFGSGDHVDVEKSAGGFSETNSVILDCEDAVDVKENLNSTKVFDQQSTQNYCNEQEHHTHQAVSDEPFCDKEKANQKNELSLFNQEYIDCDIQKVKSRVTAEVLSIEAAASSDSKVADLDGFKAEYVSDDSKEVENIAVDHGVSSHSRSRGISTDVAHTEATKAIHKQEVDNVETIKPVTPKELCTGCENPIETSNGITGTILQQIFSSGSGRKEKFCKEISECDIHNEDYSNDARRKDMDDEDIGNICSDVALLFQEDTEAMIGKSKAADGFSLEHDARDSLEVIKDQFDEHEGAANEAICLGLNQPSCGNKSKKHEVETEEADGLHLLDAKVVTTSDSYKVMDFENSNVASTSIPEMAVDCSAISPVYFSSHSENKAMKLGAESLSFTSREISMFSGHYEKNEVENSEAGASETNFVSEDARDVKDDVMIIEQVAAQVTEEQISEHKTAEEASEQENMLATIHGISDNKNLKQESPKFENTNSASDRNKPLCDNGELSTFNQEHLSYVSTEFLLIEVDATSGSNIAALDGFKKEYISGDRQEAVNNAVDPGVSNCSGSRGNSTNKEVHSETTRTMSKQDVENVGTIQSVTPKKLSAGFENPNETSDEISRTNLQQIFSSGSRWTENFHKKMNEGDVHNDMALLFQEDTETAIDKSKAADGFSPEHNARDTQEVAKDPLDEREAAADEATFRGGNRSKQHEAETEQEDAKVVTAVDSKKAVVFENSNVASTIIPEVAVDCSAISPLIFSSKCGPYGKDEFENSEAWALETNFTSEDTRDDVKDNVMVMEQVSAQVTEEQIPEHKKEEDVSKLDSNLCSSAVDEPTCKGSEASTEQENIVHGVFENTNSAAGTDTAAEDPWKLELKLLSPRPKRPAESKTGRGSTTLFAKNLNSSMMKQKSKSTLILRTPKPKPNPMLLVHDMKENLASSKREKMGNMTAEKTLSKRRALEDIKKK